MKKLLAALVLSLPWLVGLPLVGFFCRQEYEQGRSFAQEMHSFSWIANLYFIVPVYLLTASVAIVWAIVLRKQIAQSRLLKVALLLLLCSLGLPVSALWAMPKSFYAGRDAAYRALDYQEIYAAGLEFQQRVPAGDGPLQFAEWDNTLSGLPPAIARLSPKVVMVTPQGMIIQMDGGGVMYHEGIGIVFPGGVVGQFRQTELEPLDETLPVYLYRLYDCRIFLDSLQDEGIHIP